MDFKLFISRIKVL